MKETYTLIVSRITAVLRRHLSGPHAFHVRAAGYALVAFFALLLSADVFLLSPPRDFPVGVLISVERGMTLEEIASLLKEKSVIRSKNAFIASVRLIAGERGALSGDYFFRVPESAWSVAMRVSSGAYGLDPVRITVPEGATVRDIAAILEWKLPSFPAARFREAAEGHEGYLFPDTYLFLPNVEPESVVRVMRENFAEKIAPLAEEIAASGKTVSDIVIMASILEKEAITEEDKKTVAGILWKRMDIGMPLQVDAPFLYERGKNTYQLTLDDLRSDSPFNTYTNKGLPPAPIANPGLEAIEAALHPNKTPYLFYLSDRRGNMYYAPTFEEHKRNKRLYLN